MQHNRFIDSYLKLLIESRLTDAIDRYPEIENDITTFARWDPSGNQKYLMWMSKMLHSIYTNRNHRKLETTAQTKLISEIDKFILETVQFFHENSQRIKKKDINQYKTVQELYDAVEQVRSKESKTQARKTKRMKAKEGSEVVYQDNLIAIFRLYTEEAACYYGQGTQWCISATTSENYFNQYTKDENTFYVVVTKVVKMLPKGFDLDDLEKIALQYDDGRELEGIYDASDEDRHDSILYEYFDKLMELFMDGKYTGEQYFEFIQKPILKNLEANPPEPETNFEEEFEKVEEEWQDSFQHVNYYSSTDDEFPYFGASLNIGYDNYIKGSHKGWNDWNTNSSIKDAAESAGMEVIGIDEIEVETDNDSIMIDFRFRTDYYERDAHGYGEFLGDLRHHVESEFKTIVNKLRRSLVELKILKKSLIDDLADQFEKKAIEDNEDLDEVNIFKNLASHYDPDDGDITIRTPEYRIFEKEQPNTPRSNAGSERINLATHISFEHDYFTLSFEKVIRRFIVDNKKQLSFPGFSPKEEDIGFAQLTLGPGDDIHIIHKEWYTPRPRIKFRSRISFESNDDEVANIFSFWKFVDENYFEFESAIKLIIYKTRKYYEDQAKS
tara:strand:+ start:29516 stop:31351 length:1836 start_codon:yes stop_codon:yes gene_type:complete